MNKLKCAVTLSISLIVSSAQAGPVEQWREAIAMDVLQTAAVDAKAKSGDRSLCPGVQSKDYSSCFKAYLKSTEIKSAAHLSTLVQTAVKATAGDRAKGYDPTTANLMLLDNLVTLLEKVSLPRLHVSLIQPAGVPDLFHLALLKREEEAALNKAKSEAHALIRQKQAEVETALKPQKRAVAAMAKWQQATRDQLKARALRAERAAWRFPAQEKEVWRSDVTQRLKDAAKNQFCSDRLVQGCAQVATATCLPLAETAFRDCAKSLEPRSQPVFRDLASVDPYLSALGQCGAQRLMETLKRQPKAQKTPQCDAIFSLK